MSFPFETDEKMAIEDAITIPKEYEIDFKTGQFTGKVVEGLEAVKVWIYNALKTNRYRYNIFSWDYGNELEDLIGNSYTEEYLIIEVKRMVEDCLFINENIVSIKNISISMINDKLSISITVNTLFGEVNVNV